MVLINLFKYIKRLDLVQHKPNWLLGMKTMSQFGKVNILYSRCHEVSPSNNIISTLRNIKKIKISKLKTPVFEGLPAASLSLLLPELLEGPCFFSPSNASPAILVCI